jgi:Mrr N-terminal domain
MEKCMSSARTSEAEISKAVLRILSDSTNGEATTRQLISKIPNVVVLTAGDRQQSDTRENEELWEQIVRNIVSHKTTQGNVIAEGFVNRPSRGKLRITDAGRRHLGNM